MPARDSDLVLAIDPGNAYSGWTLVRSGNFEPLAFGKDLNEDVRSRLEDQWYDHLYIEMIGHYGKGTAVGASVFETCVWIGRFTEVALSSTAREAQYVKRASIKAHVVGKAGVKDGDVVRALVDRFTPGAENFGKGTRAEPGWFHGFKADIWQAYALAVYAIDKMQEQE